MTRPRQTLWLTVVLVLAIGLDAAIHRMTARYSAPLPDWAGFDPEAPDSLVITRSEVLVQLARGEDGWGVVAPYSDTADTAAIESLLAGLGAQGILDARVDSDPKNHPTYGLSGMDPIRVQVAAGETPLADLYIGHDGPGQTTFVRIPGADDVYRAHLGGRGLVDRPPGAWRDPMILDRDPADILAVSIRSRSGSVTLTRAAGVDGSAGWTLEGRPELPLDEPSVDAAVSALAGLTALEVLPSAPIELENPALELTLTFDTGSEVLRFVALRGQAFGRRQRDGRAFRIRGELLAAIARPAEAWRDRTLIRVDPSSLSALTLEEGTRQTVLERDAGVWSITAPVGIDVDPEKAGEVVRYLSALEVEGWAVLAPEDAGFPSETRVILSGDRSLVLEVGARVPGRAPGRESVFIRLASSPERVGALPVRVWVALKRAWGR